MYIRQPAVAGTFYYLTPERLRKQLKEFFSHTKKGSYLGVISPHAGYEYSGKTAAYAINSLKPAKTFIILGPNHHGLGPTFSIMNKGSWNTPFGNIKINENISAEITEKGLVTEDRIAHAYEHSIEVQLPFLQYVFKGFKFVPICIKNTTYDKYFLNECEKLGSIIAEIVKNNSNVSIIASSDFSHYLPYHVAKNKDDIVIEKIKLLNTKDFFESLRNINASVCGYGGITVLMSAAKALGLKRVDVINRSSSGDITEDYKSVVTYNAIGFK